MLCVLPTGGVEADDGFRFYYTLPTDQPFYESASSTQQSGSRQISSFRKTVEFQASRSPGSETTHLVARILSLSNKGRAIDYYQGVLFEADISPTGEISNYSWRGGLPRYRELIAVAGPANRRNIFWMPEFPDRPLFVGDSFVDRASVADPTAAGETRFELEEVRGNLAYFAVSQHGALVSAGVSGTQQSEGRAVFDFETGMWRSLELRGEGTASLPGGMTASYKSNQTKEVARYANCDQATTGVADASSVINDARRLARQLLHGALNPYPGNTDDLYVAYRHFTCPSAREIGVIGANLRAADNALNNPVLACIPASASACSGGEPINLPQTTGGAPARRHVIQLCPSFFTRMQDDERAGTLIAAGAKLSGVDDSHTCKIQDACYYDFLQPATNMVDHNPFAYGYYALERNGWTLSRSPRRTPCFPQLSGRNIRVRGGAAATNPADVQPFEGDIYEIFTDPATGDEFIRHDNLTGAQYYLRGESHMRFYLPP